jgi:hypothetical protein
MSELKNCPQCGYKTKRDFCTPQCRMEDSDNRIEGVEEENKRMREALDNIKKHLEISCASGYQMSAAWNIANEATKSEELEK